MMDKERLKERIYKIYPLHHPIWMIILFVILLLILTIPAYTTIDYIWVYFALGFWFFGLILISNSIYIHIKILRLYDKDKERCVKFIEKLHTKEQSIVNQDTLANSKRLDLLRELLDDLD